MTNQITIGHETTLSQLRTAASQNDTETLRRYCEWNDANGDWYDEKDTTCRGDGATLDDCKICDGTGTVIEPCDFPSEMYIEAIEGWFQDDPELPR